MLSAARNNNRGRGRGGGNGRAGQRFTGHGSNGSSKKKDEKKLKKFHPQVRGKYPEFSFDEVKKELVKAMESIDMDKADDIIDSIRNMQLLDLESIEPVLELRTDGMRVAVDAENEKKKEEHRIKVKRWETRVDALANNKRKLHAKTLKFCTKEMEDKLEQEQLGLRYYALRESNRVIGSDSQVYGNERRD